MLTERLAALAGLAVMTLFMAAPASALTMAECSAKYQAAKTAGTVGEQTWNQFRKSECGTDASAAADAKTSKKTAKSSDTASSDAADSAAKGLTMAECSAKYQAAKTANTLNGMKWNDFRKTECSGGAGDAAATAEPAKATKTSSDSTDSGAKGLTMAECSDKYQKAKAAGTLNGMKWNDFRKTECSGGAGDAAATAEPAKATKTSSDSTDSGAKGLTMAECSAKYQAAKTANTLKGMKWNDFRKAECGSSAAEDDTVPATDEAKYTGEPEKPSVTAPGGVKFPSAIAKKYASESPGKGRLHTCLDQYYVNKDANALGGLRWIQKGGGFYSLCNSKLKGA